MASTKERHPRLAFDVIIVAAGSAFLLLIWAAGVRAGQPIARGTGTVLGGLYATYLGMLFLLSYFFPDATHILSFLRYVCEECTCGGRGRHMAFVYFALGLGLGWLALPFGGVPSDFWVAEAYPFLSSYANPHFPLSLALLLWLMLPLLRA